METDQEHEQITQNPNNGTSIGEIKLNPTSNSKPKVIVIMGATGAGKSKLAIDLASYFPIEIINADSMQVYQGLDVITNKVTTQEQKGVPHHLLGIISPSVEFTAKDFRDSAISIINEVWSRNKLPVIVGGTNYYIQALVSPFLLDDSVEDAEANCLSDTQEDEQADLEAELMSEDYDSAYNRLKDIDPVAANRIHPNNDRKINQYLNLYARFGVIPSKLLQERTVENWGQVDNSRYDFCFVCVNASLSTLDPFVNRRVDRMVDAGLLKEALDIYTMDGDYTKGLRQAIGVREFEPFLRHYIQEHQKTCDGFQVQTLNDQPLKQNIRHIVDSPDNEWKALLTEAIEQVKLNTRRLVRRQRRRLNRLQMLFGWNIHYVDATNSIISGDDNIWTVEVVKPSVGIIKSFITGEYSTENGGNASEEVKLMQKDLWTQYVCKACGNKVLRGAHEWEEHRQGRHHRKRISRLKKSGSLCL